jgi:hypothetical protein
MENSYSILNQKFHNSIWFNIFQTILNEQNNLNLQFEQF